MGISGTVVLWIRRLGYFFGYFFCILFSNIVNLLFIGSISTLISNLRRPRAEMFIVVVHVVTLVCLILQSTLSTLSYPTPTRRLALEYFLAFSLCLSHNRVVHMHICMQSTRSAVNIRGRESNGWAGGVTSGFNLLLSPRKYPLFRMPCWIQLAKVYQWKRIGNTDGV